MVKKEYDVFVIGTGTAGKTVAYDCAAAGMKVAIADNREFGGTCANRGCDPKKVLLAAAEVVHLATNLHGKGVSAVPEVRWGELQQFKAKFTKAVPAATERDLKKAGIDMFHQSPAFIDKNTLTVEGKTVKAKKIVIASGNRPIELKIPGREYFINSDDFMALPELPDEIVFVGAGYIGMEFAQLAAHCGSRVTMVERGPAPLQGFEPQIVEELVEASKALGIEFIFNAEVVELEKLRKNIRVHYTRKGRKSQVKARMVVNAAGRVPSIDELELEKGGVQFERNGVTVNEYLQSVSNPSVYACGDVSASGSLQLTPTSSQEARIVSLNLRKGRKTKMDFPPVPTVVFTIPQLASIGLTEEEARAKGYSIRVEHKSVPGWFNSKRISERTYAYKTIVDTDRDLILGAHIISAQAGEMINLFVLAMCGKLSCAELKAMIFAYPTWGNDIKGMV